jgi:UDP-N-acetyl-D-glucosamine dehydrogenase
VSLESTTYPGTTEELLVPAATSGGLALDGDVFVAFSPERVDPGSNSPIGKIPKVVGGVSEESGRVAAAAYGRLVDSVHVVSSARAAEMTKLLENTYRAVNIALVNEMAALAHEIDIDIWEVVAAAGTKPFGFQVFYPGPGVGGHCIPLDPQYLKWRARAVGFDTQFIDLAERVNIGMPRYTVGRIAALLAERGATLSGARVLAVGAAYKPDVGDARESPAFDVIEGLREADADVEVWDPLIPGTEVAARGFELVDGPDGHDLAVVLTDHGLFDLERLAKEVPLVFDTRGAYPRRGLAFDSVVTL